MSEGPAPHSRRATILWPLTLVAAVHLLTTPGQWLLTDQAEYIAVADRLVARGTFHLSEPGEAIPRQLPWVRPAPPGEPVRSRLLPLTSVALAPFVLFDRVLWSARSPGDRPFVQLQGHVFVLAALALLGLALAEQGASAPAVAGAVVLAGLTWPVWQVSRRGGPEAIYVFLIALFLLGRARVEAGGHGVTLQCIASALIPWGNPTGAVIGGALLAGAAIEDVALGRRPRRLLAPALAWMASSAALVGVWNLAYHGNWVLGGYAQHLQAPGTVVDAGSMPRVVALHLWSILVEAGPLVAVALIGAASGGRRARASLAAPVVLTGALLALFATFPQPEPTRRLAAAWPAWGVAAGLALDRLRFTLPARQAVLALAAVVGFHGFWTTEGRYHAGPGGLFYPSVVWVRLWIESAPAWQFAVPSVALLVVIAVATARTSRLLAAHPPANA